MKKRTPHPAQRPLDPVDCELIRLLPIFITTSLLIPVTLTLLAGTLARLLTNTMRKFSLR